MASPTPSLPVSLPELPSRTPAKSNTPLVTKENTPTSLLLKLHLPAQRLRDLITPTLSTAGSVQSSPPPSSPVASTGVADARPLVKKKPAPKSKKTKVVIGGDGKPVEVAAPQIGGSKLGPKANAGAINENLRNLDRSGKPCRRWAKRPVTVRSVNGTKWRCPSWLSEATAA